MKSKKIILASIAISLTSLIIIEGNTAAKDEGVAKAVSTWQPVLLVGLNSGNTRSIVVPNIACAVKDVATGKVLAKIVAGETVLFETGSKLKLAGREINSTKVELVPDDERNLAAMILKIDNKEYRGGVQIFWQRNGLVIINKVPVECYLSGVLPGEMPSTWPAEAVRAQAVAARTFALNNRQRHSEDGFDLCSTNHCQFYGGMAVEETLADRAIAATRGEVLWSGERLVDAPFHTDSGGMTESSEAVWGSPSSHLLPASELQMNTQPWNVEFKLSEVQTKLNQAHYKINNIKEIFLSPLTVGKAAVDRSASGRVKTVRFNGSQGSATVSGNDMRNIFVLKSTLFDMKLTKDMLIISGFGWGHGVGMSQWGAKAYASILNYRDILKHYYNKIEINKLY